MDSLLGEVIASGAITAKKGGLLIAGDFAIVFNASAHASGALLFLKEFTVAHRFCTEYTTKRRERNKRRRSLRY